MSKRLVVGVVLAGAVTGSLLFACSSADSHPDALTGCASTFGCSPPRPKYNATAGDGGTEAGDAAPDSAIDAADAADAADAE